MQTSTTWSISLELLNKIEEVVSLGSTILELGSGEGTGELIKRGYNLISIEHNEEWLNKYNSHYIHAKITPFKKPCAVFSEDKGWYDREVLRNIVPNLAYDAILVDGPPSNIGRGGFCKYIDIFNTNLPIFFDDVERTKDRKMVSRVSAKLKRPYTVYGCWTERHWALMLP